MTKVIKKNTVIKETEGDYLRRTVNVKSYNEANEKKAAKKGLTKKK